MYLCLVYSTVNMGANSDLTVVQKTIDNHRRSLLKRLAECYIKVYL